MTLPNPHNPGASEVGTQTSPGNGQTVQLPSAASAALPRPGRVPQSKRRSRVPWWLVPGGALSLAVVIFLGWFVFFRSAQARTDLEHTKVAYRDVQLKVVERGSLEAIKNNDVKCNVKPGSRAVPKIMWVIDNGAPVEKGDLLVEIDDSALQEQLVNQKIAMDNAEALKVAAEQNQPIFDANLKQWDAGDFPQQRDGAASDIQVADSTYQQQKDRTAWVSRMVRKGYMTASQEESEKANEEGCRLDLEKKKKILDVLIKYTDPTNHKTKANAITAGLADLKTKTQVYEAAKALYDDLQQQIKDCKVVSPASGNVVYYIPEQSMRGMGANQSTIAQGEPINYGQTMLRVPDLAHMQVNVRIHEAFINHMDVKARLEKVDDDGPAAKAGLKPGDLIVQLGKRKIKSYTELIEALRRHLNEKVKVKVQRGSDEIEIEVNLAQQADQQGQGSGSGYGSGSAPVHNSVIDPSKLFGAQFQIGLPATVRVDAVPGKTLKAHVKSVSSVAAPQDWMSPDVKVYQAYVEIDDDVRDLNLKPGLSAVCTIMTEAEVAHVLAVPVQAIVSPVEKGGKPSVFVMPAGGGGVEQHIVELGLTDDKYVEIKDGLSEGDEIVLNPRTLLGEKKGGKPAGSAVPGGSAQPGANGGSAEGGAKGRK